MVYLWHQISLPRELGKVVKAAIELFEVISVLSMDITLDIGNQ